MIYLILACLVTLGDQFFKYWISGHIEPGGKLALIPGVVHLTYVENTGAAFSSFSGQRWLLVGVTGVCIVLIVLYMFKTKFGKAVRIPLALVLGGAVGNLIDRIFVGYVVDMFELEFVRYAVFNVADICINIGAIAFVILFLVKSRQADKAKARAKAEREKKLHDAVSSSMTDAPGEQSAEEILREARMKKYMGEDGDDAADADGSSGPEKK